jgi:hypothetical protein
MGTAESKIKAQHQSEILTAHAPWEMGRLIRHASKQRPSWFFSSGKQLLIDFFRLYDNIPKRKSEAIPKVPV